MVEKKTSRNLSRKNEERNNMASQQQEEKINKENPWEMITYTCLVFSARRKKFYLLTTKKHSLCPFKLSGLLKVSF